MRNSAMTQGQDPSATVTDVIFLVHDQSRRLFTVGLLLTLSACTPEPLGFSANEVSISGTWEALLKHTQSPQYHLLQKGRLTLRDRSYSYHWLQKKTDSAGNIINEWMETARDIGDTIIERKQMRWVSRSYGTTEYDPLGNAKPKQMRPSRVNYVVAYSVAGNQLTIKEDYNLDGDYDDLTPVPETIIYTRVN